MGIHKKLTNWLDAGSIIRSKRDFLRDLEHRVDLDSEVGGE